MNILKYIKHYKIWAIIILILLIICSWYWFQKQSSPETLLAKVGHHIELPANESPAIATVSDKTKLASQQFFTDAYNGDILLIYNSSQKAILYRPSIDKIINVTTVNIHTEKSPTNQPTAIPSTAPLKVAIYNGTQIQGLASRYEKLIKTKVTTVTIVSKTNTKLNYSENLVIDITGKNTAEAENIASQVHATVSAFPKGEQKPTADILIILGKDL